MSLPNLMRIHLGKNIERIRELKGIKQESLASTLGVSQQAISKMEQSAVIEEGKLKKIAEALEVTIDDIKNFKEEIVFHNNVYEHGTVYNYVETFQNPTDKLIELYERLLKEKDEQIKALQATEK